MTAGEHVVATFTTDTPFDEVASAEWVAGDLSKAPVVETGAAVTVSGSSVAVVTVEIAMGDTDGLNGDTMHQLWLYDSAGDGIVAASGWITVIPSLLP